MRIFETPLGNLSRLIRKPVSLMLSLLLDDELFVDPKDDVVDEDDDDFCIFSLNLIEYKEIQLFLLAGVIDFDTIEMNISQ